MTRNDIVRALNGEYARLREDNMRLRDERIREVTAADASIGPLIDGGVALFQRQARALLAHPERAQALAQETRRLAENNDRQLRARLKKLGYPENYLDPVYRCAVCRDTGYVGDTVRGECACFRQRVAQRLFEEAGAGSGAEQTFASYDESIIPNAEKVNGVDTQRELTGIVRDVCRQYARDYPHTEKPCIVLVGKSGLGKTFLLNCIENELIGRGFAPVKVTGYRMFEAMRGYHFGEEDKRVEFSQMISCDILLIDDLGTEPVMKNITVEYLFTLLNERLVQKRHTVVATNLSMNDLLARYGERVFSRLVDSVNAYAFILDGKDLRLNAMRK